jgi:predicted nucleic acid-binding protein
MASNFNIKVQGILGVLLMAKLRGLIPVIKPVVDELIGKAGFWVSQAVYTRVLQLADEI